MRRLNERRAAEFEAEGSAEAGFTLIELMVVLLILAILLAIAIPTFLGVTGSANDRAAQSNLNTALTNAKSIYEQNSQAYPTGTATTTCAAAATITNLALAVSIGCNEPSLSMNTAITAGDTVGLAAGATAAISSNDGNGAVVYTLAKATGECWWVSDNPATITANGPWTAAVAGLPATVAGVPEAQGVYFGVFKVGTNLCNQAGLLAAHSNIATPGFPKAA
jgi:type IV pilus assembly protein PilA